MRVIMVNLDAIDDLGNLPYRLAKPVLMLMSAEKLLEIERASPVRRMPKFGWLNFPKSLKFIHFNSFQHLRDEDQGSFVAAACSQRAIS